MILSSERFISYIVNTANVTLSILTDLSEVKLTKNSNVSADNVELKKIKQPIKKPIHVCMYGVHIYRHTAALFRVVLEM